MDWTVIAIVAIVIWGVVSIVKARAGIISDEDGNETYVGREDTGSRAELEETKREIEQLRERLHVLERIATDANNPDARERARIAAEIESLRLPHEPTLTQKIPTPQMETKGEQAK